MLEVPTLLVVSASMFAPTVTQLSGCSLSVCMGDWAQTHPRLTPTTSNV